MLAEDILKEFYAEQLPIWNHLIEEGIKREIATWTRDPAENAERLERYWPLLTQFTASFSKQPLTDNPRMLKALASMDPDAYAVDAAYKIKQGKSFASIVQGHVDAMGAMWEALNIAGYALEAAEIEYVGKQTARMALKFKNVDLAQIESAARKKATATQRVPAEIASAVGLALSELLAKSGNKRPLTENWEIPPGPLGDKIRGVLHYFDPSTAQAQDAITKKHRIAPTMALNILSKERQTVKHLRQGLNGTDYIATLKQLMEKHPILKNKITLSTDAFAKNNQVLVNFTNEDPIEYPFKFEQLDQIQELGSKEDKKKIQTDLDEQPDGLCEAANENAYHKLIIDQAARKLTRKQRHIVEYMLSNPDTNEVEIAQALQITRKTVYNCKKKLHDLLPHPTK